MDDAAFGDCMRLSARRNMRWYHDNLMKVLHDAKEKHVRDIDITIGVAKKLIEKLDEKLEAPEVISPHPIEQQENDDLMKPIKQEVLDIFYKSTEKGGAERYLKERNKEAPEDKFYFRIVTSWDYGWQQKQSRLLGRSVNYGRSFILRKTAYRKNNMGPDPPHYGQPSGAEVSICSQYSCNPN